MCGQQRRSTRRRARRWRRRRRGGRARSRRRVGGTRHRLRSGMARGLRREQVRADLEALEDEGVVVVVAGDVHLEALGGGHRVE